MLELIILILLFTMLLLGGGACYSNISTLTTGNFGEWKTEQSGVGAGCNNASSNYFLEININNESQGGRRRLIIWDFLRKDVDSKITGATSIINNIQTGSASPTSLLVQNIASNTTAATVFRIQNEIGKFITLVMGSNKTNIANITGNQGVLSYNGGNSFSFSMLNFPASWIWRNTFSPSLNNVTIDRLMELTKTGSLILYHGDININGAINSTGNINSNGYTLNGTTIKSWNEISSGNSLTAGGNYLYNDSASIYFDETKLNSTIDARAIRPDLTNYALKNQSETFAGNITTTQTGFFGYLGSLTSRITKLFVQDIDAMTINATNITTTQYHSVDAGEIKIGLTSSQFRVCKKFKVPDNACEEWCKLEITGGIITNCK